MVREHQVTMLSANHVNILCMGLCVSGGSHTQYTYMIGSRAQPRGVPRPCKYFSDKWCESVGFEWVDECYMPLDLNFASAMYNYASR